MYAAYFWCLAVIFTVYTLSGNDNHAPCVFPFIYDGMKFTECTYKGCKHNKVWCATTSNYDKDKKWGHCQTDSDVTADCIDRHSRCGEWARDGECVVNGPYMCKKCPRSCGLCTHGGNGRGGPCKFPFFYKDRFVYDCLRFNKKTWCATTTNYNKDKRWGYCFPKCEFELLSCFLLKFKRTDTSSRWKNRPSLVNTTRWDSLNLLSTSKQWTMSSWPS